MSGPGPAREQHSELRRRRDELAEQVAELHWNLGGLTYEMAIRDHFRIDVLVRRAAILQERDAELAEVERLLQMEEGSIAGSCSSCGAVRSRGAVFCWQCGAKVMERSTGVSGANVVTVEINPGTADSSGNRTTAQPVRAPLGIPREADQRCGSVPIVAPHSGDGALGRPVQASP